MRASAVTAWTLALCLWIWAGQDAAQAEDAPPPAAGSTPPGGTTEETYCPDLDYAQLWAPMVLLSTGGRLFAPVSHRDFLTVGSEAEVLTGLAATPGGSEVFISLASEKDSRLLRGHAVDGTVPELRPVLGAESLGHDLWFHEAMSVSPGGRWLLVAVSPSRGSSLMAQRQAAPDGFKPPRDCPSDIWLIDCGPTGPAAKLLLPGVRLLSCAWAPSGRYVACGTSSWSDGRSAMARVDLETGEVRVIATGRGHACWSADGCRLQVYTATPEGATLRTLDIATGQVQTELVGGVPITLWSQATWCGDGTTGGLVTQSEGEFGLTICDSAGQTTQVPTSCGVTRVLGWSSAGDLLAYCDPEGRLHFRVCAAAEPEVGALSSVWVAPEGFPEPLGDFFGTHTSRSPQTISSAEPLLSAWLEGPLGPVFVYADNAGSGGRTIQGIEF